MIVHPSYDANKLSDDIGLMRLSSSIAYSQGGRQGRGAVGPVCLPSYGQEFTGRAVVSGWGATKEGGFRSNVLKALLIKLLPKASCRRYPYYKRETQICAGFESGGQDSCQVRHIDSVLSFKA